MIGIKAEINFFPINRVNSLLLINERRTVRFRIFRKKNSSFRIVFIALLAISVDYRQQSVSVCSADLWRRCWPFKRYQARVEPEAARRRWQRHGPTAALAFLGLLLWLLGVSLVTFAPAAPAWRPIMSWAVSSRHGIC